MRFWVQALEEGGMREKVELATKFGVVLASGKRTEYRGDPEYVRAACEGSLKRLGIDSIDLYFQHRVDTHLPIELTVSSIIFLCFAMFFFFLISLC